MLIALFWIMTVAGATFVTESYSRSVHVSHPPPYPVFLTTSQLFDNGQVWNTTLTVDNLQSTASSHWLYIVINVTGNHWSMDPSQFTFSNVTINGQTYNALSIGPVTGGYEWAFGGFQLTLNQAVSFPVQIYPAQANPLLMTGAPYGDYEITFWIVGQS